MSFLAPAAFALAALIPIVIAMYLLKLRRTEQVVSSVYLWRRMVRDVEANAPWQKLRRNLLLLVQLLFLGALILALARPFTWAEGLGGQAAILILDASASMQATDVQPNRLQAAKERARQMVDGLGEDARVTVIAAGEGAQVLAASSQDRRQVRLAIDSVEGQMGGSDLTAALELASAIAARQPDTEIVVFSDGRVVVPERLRLSGRVRYVPMGIEGDNQAISVFSLQAAPGRGLTAFVQIANYGDELASRRLSLLADGQLVGAYDVEIPAGGQRAVVADLAPETHQMEARLSGEDALPLDDRAWAVNRTGDQTRVNLITEGNLFLETALALFANLEVTTIRPADFEAGATDPGAPTSEVAGLTILDAYVPVTVTLPAGNLLFIAPPRSTPYFSVTGTVAQPLPRAVTAVGGESSDPLLAYVNLSEVSVLEAVRISLPVWARPVIAGDVASDGGTEPVPLLFAGRPEENRRVAVLTFDLRNSDLPLQVAFPLLLANLTGWLAPEGSGGLPSEAVPNTLLSWAVPPGVEVLQVTRPDGSTMRLVPEEGRALLSDTGQLGIYEIAWGEEERTSLAVNLFSPQESSVAPASELPLAGTEETADSGTPLQARREWWRPLAFAALLLLAAEWGIYQRATLVRLWVGLRGRLRAERGA